MTRDRSSLTERALQLIAEGRLVVTWVDHERVEAHVRGTDTTHTVGYRRGGWYCDCEAARHAQRCSHQLVCRRPERQPAGLTAQRFRAEQAEANRVRESA